MTVVTIVTIVNNVIVHRGRKQGCYVCSSIPTFLIHDDPKLYQSAQNSISEHLFPKMFPGGGPPDPRTPTYCVPFTNPVEHPYLQLSSYPYGLSSD